MRAITCNLGCGGPGGAKFVEPAHAWAKAVRDQSFDVVFAQEIPADNWLDEWKQTFDVFVGTEPEYRVRSALLIRRSLGATALKAVTAPYHGSYVAGANLPTRDRGWVSLMSIHASPTRLTDRDLTKWRQCGQTLPTPRYEDELWDADLALDTVRLVQSRSPVITAGDWNEARRWDDHHAGTWGNRFFARVKAIGLTDSTWARWRTERPTCRASKNAEYQTDHILVSRQLAGTVKHPRIVTDGMLAGGSDHWPIVFDLNL